MLISIECSEEVVQEDQVIKILADAFERWLADKGEIRDALQK